MRPVVAKRPTICAHCKKTIEPGSDRLDDVIRAGKNVTGGTFYKRLHYHPPCYIQKVADWFEENRDKEVVYPHSGGRPALDLTPEQKAKRQQLLIKLSNLFGYYVPRLDLQTPTSELSYQALKVMMNFQHRFKNITDSLKSLGGLPPRYRDMQLPDFADALKSSVVMVDDEEDKDKSEIAVTVTNSQQDSEYL